MKYKKMIRSNHRLLTNGFFVESYRYDALGRRTATVNAEGAERHVWDGDHCLADVDEEGNALRAYLWGPGVDNLLAVRVGGRNYAALTDIQGTVWGYADERGEIVARWTCDAWGNVITEEVNVPALRSVRYRFQGREISHATGLANFRARWCDPTTGRWLSKDPIGLSGGLNLYVFCGNMPLTHVDPSGLFDLEELSAYASGAWDGLTDDFWGNLGRGAAATADGLIPWGDPFSGFYEDKCDDAYDVSRKIGMVSSFCISPVGGTRGLAALSSFRPFRLLNQNRYLRIGKGNIHRGKPLTDGAGQGVPTMRIGNKKPSVWNHFDLRLWRH